MNSSSRSLSKRKKFKGVNNFTSSAKTIQKNSSPKRIKE